MMTENTKIAIAVNMLVAIPMPVGLVLPDLKPQKLSNTRSSNAGLFVYRL